MPNRLAHLLALYGLGEKKVLDVGSGYGQFLIHFGAGSTGIELDPHRYQFARSIGLNVLPLNFEEKWPDIEASSMDCIWACNVLEHTVSPFLFLRKLHQALAPGGLAVIGIPTMPKNAVASFCTKAIFGKLGYESMEHTMSFTTDTAKFLLSRTGFDVEDANVFVTKNPSINRLLRPIVPTMTSQVVLVARKTEDYEKPRILPPNWYHANL